VLETTASELSRFQTWEEQEDGYYNDICRVVGNTYSAKCEIEFLSWCRNKTYVQQSFQVRSLWVKVRVVQPRDLSVPDEPSVALETEYKSNVNDRRPSRTMALPSALDSRCSRTVLAGQHEGLELIEKFRIGGYGDVNLLEIYLNP